jgi:protein-arginine deiminase
MRSPSLKLLLILVISLSTAGACGDQPMVGMDAGTGAGSGTGGGGGTGMAGSTGGRGATGGAGGAGPAGGAAGGAAGTSGGGQTGSAGASATGGAGAGGTSAGGAAAMGGAGAGGAGSGGRAGGGGTSASGGRAGGGGTSASGGTGTGGTGASAGSGGAGGGAGSGAGLSILTDTNRDGTIDGNDAANLTSWDWKSQGALFIANVDDDDRDGRSDGADQTVNGEADAKDLARLLIKVGAASLARAKAVSVSVTNGAGHVHVFERMGATWRTFSGPLGQFAAELELGIEGVDFADAGWDGKATVKVDLVDGATIVESQSVTLRVAPWLLLPGSAKTERVYIIGSNTGASVRSGIDAVLRTQGLPACQTPTPAGQDQWYQDTMEIGYTQLPGSPPMHVVMTAQRGPGMDNVAKMLLAPDFGFISIGAVRSVSTGGFGGDHWIDWMGNLEVTHPMPGHPFGRVFHGKSSNTTFHPTILKFIEAQELQMPIALNTEWLVIQHVDEIVSFVMGKDGRPRMLVPSPAAANEILKTGYDANQQRVQGYIDETIAVMKREVGIADVDIVQLPLYFDGAGQDFSARWSDPVNSLFIDGTFVIGQTGTPTAIKTSIESKLDAVGIKVAWVDDVNYQNGGGNVHCGTNAAKTPPCANFATCLK